MKYLFLCTFYFCIFLTSKSRYLKANCAHTCVMYTEEESVENMKRAFEVDHSSEKYLRSKYFTINLERAQDDICISCL